MYTRARILILSDLLSYPCVKNINWESNTFTNVQAAKGDLVALGSAPASKWYLSWVEDVDIKKDDRFSTRYLLRSIEDGELCWWCNISLTKFNRSRIQERPQYRWTDKQFEFNDRWNKVFKRQDAYIIRPKLPVFHPDKAVTLNVRIMGAFNDFSYPKTFEKWPKLTIKKMTEYYLEAEKIYHSRNLKTGS